MGARAHLWSVTARRTESLPLKRRNLGWEANSLGWGRYSRMQANIGEALFRPHPTLARFARRFSPLPGEEEKRPPLGVAEEAAGGGRTLSQPGVHFCRFCVCPCSRVPFHLARFVLKFARMGHWGVV